MPSLGCRPGCSGGWCKLFGQAPRETRTTAGSLPTTSSVGLPGLPFAAGMTSVDRTWDAPVNEPRHRCEHCAGEPCVPGLRALQHAELKRSMRAEDHPLHESGGTAEIVDLMGHGQSVTEPLPHLACARKGPAISGI